MSGLFMPKEQEERDLLIPKQPDFEWGGPEALLYSMGKTLWYMPNLEKGSVMLSGVIEKIKSLACCKGKVYDIGISGYYNDTMDQKIIDFCSADHKLVTGTIDNEEKLLAYGRDSNVIFNVLEDPKIFAIGKDKDSGIGSIACSDNSLIYSDTEDRCYIVSFDDLENHHFMGPSEGVNMFCYYADKDAYFMGKANGTVVNMRDAKVVARRSTPIRGMCSCNGGLYDMDSNAIYDTFSGRHIVDFTDTVDAMCAVPRYTIETYLEEFQ